ncbi:MAG: hypothetical protein K6T81_03350 [Alicyclobacillus macrosporangiidus]|uniref:MutS-related protein n=1 Tax=Alicyclobacillus macrosporangiidus TaxID=392015 RepID=UPI0026F08312|nr:hypothetical protein [Alicyclobacillus macrosporangiidus]MCL6597759.1 hypothetical protein [Alicyclobacillus macrosporangiidus]
MQSIPFLDDITASSIGWPAVWAAWAPVTPYGLRAKAAHRPFLPGEEEAWQAALAQLAADLTAVADGPLRRAQEGLRSLPDVADDLAILAQDRPLSARAALALKTFLRIGGELARDTGLQLLRWTDAAAWDRLLEYFGDAGPSFSVDSVADDTYRLLRSRLAEASVCLARERQREAERWRREAGVRPDANGLLHIPLPAGRAVAERLKAEPGVRWCQDTPFESVFECLPGPDAARWMAEVASCRAALAEAEERCMARLAEGLRAEGPVWRRLVDDVASLDLRLARVALARRWGGCAPEAAVDDGLSDAAPAGIRGFDHPSIQLHRGVHPGLAERLAARGGRVTPIDVDVAAGVNVIAGMNMGGKTAAVQLVALCQALAQHALPVPAAGFRTRLFACVRWGPEPERPDIDGLSAFGREVTRLTRIWQDTWAVAPHPALVLLDEPGRTTNPREGEAMAVAWAEALREAGQARVTAVIASHFTRVAALPGVAHHRVRGVRLDRLPSPSDDPQGGDSPANGPRGGDSKAGLRALAEAIDYRLERVEGGGVPEEGIAVAAWLGLPDAVLRRARALLAGERATPEGPADAPTSERVGAVLKGEEGRG